MSNHKERQIYYWQREVQEAFVRWKEAQYMQDNSLIEQARERYVRARETLDALITEENKEDQP